MKTSKYRGVSWCKVTKKYRADISVNNKTVYIGVYKNEEEAALAYNEAAKLMHGSKAVLNRF